MASKQRSVSDLTDIYCDKYIQSRSKSDALIYVIHHVLLSKRIWKWQVTSDFNKTIADNTKNTQVPSGFGKIPCYAYYSKWQVTVLTVSLQC